jgi:hypothetical protein
MDKLLQDSFVDKQFTPISGPLMYLLHGQPHFHVTQTGYKTNITTVKRLQHKIRWLTTTYLYINKGTGFSTKTYHLPEGLYSLLYGISVANPDPGSAWICIVLPDLDPRFRSSWIRNRPYLFPVVHSNERDYDISC